MTRSLIFCEATIGFKCPSCKHIPFSTHSWWKMLTPWCFCQQQLSGSIMASKPASPQTHPFQPPRLAADQHPQQYPQSCWKASPSPSRVQTSQSHDAPAACVVPWNGCHPPFVGCHNKSLGVPQGPPCMTPQGGAQGPPPGPVQCLLHPGSPFLTPVGTPDTLSESGSIKSSSRSRRAMNNSRTLPFLPPEEPAPLPSQAKSKSGSDRMKAFASFRQSSLDGLTGGMTSRAGYGGLARPRPSNSESNLRKLALEDRNRPVSALGLLQGSYLISHLWW